MLIHSQHPSTALVVSKGTDVARSIILSRRLPPYPPLAQRFLKDGVMHVRFIFTMTMLLGVNFPIATWAGVITAVSNGSPTVLDLSSIGYSAPSVADLSPWGGGGTGTSFFGEIGGDGTGIQLNGEINELSAFTLFVTVGEAAAEVSRTLFSFTLTNNTSHPISTLAILPYLHVGDSRSAISVYDYPGTAISISILAALPFSSGSVLFDPPGGVEWFNSANPPPGFGPVLAGETFNVQFMVGIYSESSVTIGLDFIPNQGFAFIEQPQTNGVPTPASLTLLCLGLFGIGATRRRLN